MNAKERSEAWAIDQLDPDNWLEIPDFGVLPQEVGLEGFAFPLVSPTVRGDGLRRIIREQVKTARALIRLEKQTLAEVKANYLEVLNMMTDSQETAKIDATHAQAMATFYMVSMGSAERASRQSFGGHGGVLSARSQALCYEALAQCEEGIRNLAVRSARAKTEAVSMREIRSAMGRNGAMGKLAKDKDGKQQNKATVRECWEAWQKKPELYASKAAFARDMREKFESLQSQPVIEGWCRTWERQT